MPKTNTNEEISQSLARVVIGSLVAIFILVMYYRSDQTQSNDLWLSFLGVSGYTLAAFGWLFWVKKTPEQFQNRRYISVLGDLFTITFTLHLSASNASYFYPLYLWVIVGNGLRFGARFLLVGIVAGFLGFGSLLAFNPFWQSNLNIGIGLLAGVVILPLFYLKVLNRSNQLNQRLEEELEKSKAAEKAKGDFLANMSHEIRTPMNGVLGMVEILGDTNLDPTQREQLTIIQRSADSLLNILNDILDYSKIASGKLEMEEIVLDLKETLQDVIRLLKPTAEDKGIELLFDFPDDQPKIFLGDPTRIRQIIFNLVGNGLKFTENGQVVISCRCSHRNERHNVIIDIKDSGVGIPEDRLEAIFEQFEQAENGTTRKFGGTGLGLAICRQLSALMGGEVTVRSILGVGTTFSVNLTLTPSTALVSIRPLACALPDFGFKALVAEDNTVNQLVVRKLLAKVGISIDLAKNGQEAVRMTAEKKYDLIFMDVRMPIMNGLEATRKIRAAHHENATIPIIALTADASADDATRCLEAGMNAHLRKPLKLQELLMALDQLMPETIKS